MRSLRVGTSAHAPGAAAMACALAIVAAAATPLTAQDPPDRRARTAPFVYVGGHLGSTMARAELGIYLDVAEDQAQTAGARIVRVLEGSPADEAGIRRYDVITHVDGQSLAAPLPNPEEEDDLDPDQPLAPQRLASIIRHYDSGDVVELRYRRDGVEGTASVTLRERSRTIFTGDLGRGVAYSLADHDFVTRLELDSLRGTRIIEGRPFAEGIRFHTDSIVSARIGDVRLFSDSIRAAFVAPSVHMVSRILVNGHELRELDEALGEYFGGSDGVLVLRAPEDSRLNLRAGDVILRVGEDEVDEPEDVSRALRALEPGDPVNLTVRRQGREVQVQGTAGGR